MEHQGTTIFLKLVRDLAYTTVIGSLTFGVAEGGRTGERRRIPLKGTCLEKPGGWA